MWQLVGLCILIAIIMWILSSLFSTKEEEQPTAQSTPRKPAMSRPRSSASDIERFLEEMNRRRRQAPQEPPPLPKPPQQSRRPRPARVETVAMPAPAPAPKRPPSRRRAAVEAVVAEQPRPRPDPDSDRIEILDEGPAPPPAVPVVTRIARPVSPALATLLPLLVSKQQLRSALLLHDILGQPRCRRPMGHPQRSN